MRIFKKLGWQRAWITLPFFVLGSSFLFSFFRSPIRPFSGPVFWVNAIWTLVFWIWIHQVFEELIHFFGRSFWGKSVLYFLIGSFALLSSFCFLLNTGLYLSQGEFLTSHMLRFIQSEPNYLKIFARDYIGGMEIGFWAVGVGLLFKYWKNSVFHHPFLREIRVRRVSFFLISVILILSYNWVDKFTNSRQRTLDLATVSSVSQLYSSRWSSGKKLHAAHREKLHSLEGADLPNLDIILVIVESWGKQGLQAYGNGQGLMPFLEAWAAREPDTFLAFKNAFSNSNVTDLSMPSILTGVGPHESLTKLHAFPLLWQWARAAKMASVYVSAETYEWAQFSSFFFTEAPDFWMTADLMAARFGVASGKRNDGGVDDLLATQVFIERMSQVPPAQRLMGIFNPNALHMPCQAESPLMPANGPRRRTRCENGLAILDQSLSMIYGFLEKSGRLDRTLVILTADHGDTEKPQHIFPRISSFYSEIMNIPFWIRIPKAWKQDQAEAFRHLRQATEKNVMNLDILPTVVDFLKLDRHPQNQKLTTQWEGRSLLRTLDSHRPLIALNSTEYKNCPQPGLGVYWDHYRFVYTQAMGPELYDIDQDPFELRNVWKKGPHSSHSFEIESLVQKTPALRRIWQIQP